MNKANQARHDFKEIGTANWQSADEQTAPWVGMTAAAKTPAEWVGYYLRPRLKPTVPMEIVTLLEVARGAMIYGWFFYPLLTLGAEQCWRVLESGVRLRCQQIGIQTKRPRGKGREEDTTFSENVTALFGRPFAMKLNKSRWDAVRGLRSSTSHPSRQMILDPAQTKGVLETAVELLNDLFS
jgi:hypothetical protein